MTHKHREGHHFIKPGKGTPSLPDEEKRPKLELVLKADSAGSLEALVSAVSEIILSEIDINIIRSSIGDINKSDILLAETGSRLVVGFQVEVLAGLESSLKDHRVEARLYNVIYDITADIQALAEAVVTPSSEEELMGAAKVIAIFKSSRRGSIIGCEVLNGFLSTGRSFRIINVMGPVYSGRIESIHIEDKPIQKAVQGQRIGIKIKDFNKAKIGDLVESFRTLKRPPAWEPAGRIIRR